MKMIFVLRFAALAAVAQEAPGGLDGVVQTNTPRRLRAQEVKPRSSSPSKVTRGKITYSGTAVQAVRTRQPLQLVNPAAPARYGDGYLHLVTGPTTSWASGWKLFSLSF